MFVVRYVHPPQRSKRIFWAYSELETISHGAPPVSRLDTPTLRTLAPSTAEHTLRTNIPLNKFPAMNRTIEIRSLLCGVLVGAIAVLCLGAALKPNNQTGRFLLETGELQTAFIIDTVTGQVWENGNLQQFFAPKAEENKL